MLTFLFILALMFVVGQIIKYAFPRILYWYMRRKMRQRFTQESQRAQGFDPFGQNARSQGRRKKKQPRNPYTGKRKIFGPDEGEYVEFEDIPTYKDPNDPTEPPTPKKSGAKDESQISDAEWEDIK